MRATHNADVVIKSGKALHRRFVDGSRKSLNRAGRIMRDAVKDEIPPPKGSGKFPGYKARGTLKNAPVVKGPTKLSNSPGDWQVEIVMRPNNSKAYQRIHEVGGIIRARNAKMLVFPKPPDWAPRSTPIPGNKAYVFRSKRDGKLYVAAKMVRIKRKQYFSTGVKNGYRKIARDFPKWMVQSVTP